MISLKSIQKIKKLYHGNPLVIEGANGSVGLSILSNLKHFKIKPNKLILTTRSSEIDNDWKIFDKNLIHLKSNSKNFSKRRENCISKYKKINVIYCAGYGRPNLFLNDQEGIIEANIINLIDYSIFKNIESFAFMSTAEIYSGLNGSVKENSKLITTPNHPRGVYIESKRLSESIISNILSRNIKRCVSFRVALAFPPKLLEFDNRVLSDLINNAKKNGYVNLNGGGNFVRQYQYGPLCALKILAAMSYGNSNLYNNSGNFIIKLKNLGELIAKIFEVKFVNISNFKHDKSAPKNVLVNSNLLNKEIGYQTKNEKNFEHYLRKMINAKNV